MRSWVVVVASAVCTTTGAAQTAQHSAIVGRVLDPSGAAVTGAQVELGGEAVLGGTRVTYSDDDGKFRFVALLPGSYSISVRAPGFEPHRRGPVVLPVETTYTVDLVLGISPVASRITVRGEAPLVDISTAARPEYFGDELLRNLPANRTLDAVLNLAPGVTRDVAYGGTEGTSNGFSIDRVSLADPFLGESWVPVGYTWLQGVQVIAVGAPAEYNQFTGAIANGVLRSGSNTWSGLGEFVATVPDWTGNNTRTLDAARQRTFAPRDIETAWDASGQLGGPLRRDRLWIFSGVGSFRERFRPFNYSGDARTDRVQPRGLVKLDAASGASVLLQGFYQIDHTFVEGDGLANYAPTLVSTGDVRRTKHSWHARATWMRRSSLLIEARIGGMAGVDERVPHPPATTSGPPVQLDLSTFVFSGNVVNEGEDERRAVVTSGRLSWACRLFGQWHDVTAGAEYESTRSSTWYRNGAGRIDEVVGDVVVTSRVWDGNRNTPRHGRTGAYVQDRWNVGSRLTIEPGLRVDAYRGHVPGAGEVLATTPLAARLGAAWDLRGDHRTVVRAHYGRYHDQPFSYVYSWHDVSGVTPRIGLALGPSGSLEEVARNSDPEVPAFPVTGHLRQPHVDQFTTGIEHQWGSDAGVEARWVHREFGRFIGYLDRRLADWKAFDAPDPGPDGRLGTTDDGERLSGFVPYWYPEGTRDLVITNPPDAFRDYDAVQFIARKRLSATWQGDVSLTWSRSRETVPGSRRTNATYSGLSPLGVAGDRSTAEMGPRRSLFEYREFKALGFYRARWLGGAVGSAVYRWSSGARWHRRFFASDPLTGYTDYVNAEEPNSRQLPSIRSLDVRVEKTFRLGASRTLGAYVDFFNVTNVGRPLAVVSFSGPRLGQPTAWTDPRTGRLGVRYSF
jgi:hypothetical protein